MASVNDKELIDSLYNYTVKVMKESNPYATKESISRRVLQECADILNVDLNNPNNKSIMFIHSDNMEKIDSKWQNLIDRGTKIPHDDHNAYKLLKASQFVNILDVQRFLNFLSNNAENEFLSELLAIDGFQGFTEHKNYVENLKIGDKGSDNVQIIREIYKKFNVPVKAVHYALLLIYESHATDEEVKKMIIERKDEFADKVADYDIQPIMDMYENSISDLKSIALTKLAQLKNLKKKAKANKRKLHIAVKETKKSKKVKGDDTE